MTESGRPPLLSSFLRKLEALAADRFDRRFGIETSASVTESAFDGMPQRVRRDAIHYTACGIARIRRLIRRSGVEPRDYHFVDLGCGKGRVLFVAESFGFRSITGVEADRDLVEAAEANLKIWRKSHPRTSISVIHASAEDAQLPGGDLFVFLNNPFVGKVLETVAQKLGELARDDRRIVVAFSGDRHADVFARDGAFRRERLRPIRPWLKASMSIFRSASAECKNAGQP